MVASILVALKCINFGCRIFISFQAGLFIKFNSAPESLKKLFQGLLFAIVWILAFLKEVGLSIFFL